MKRPYALDVIAALKLKSFVNFLIERSIDDIDGHTITTLNTLVDKDNFKDISEHYRLQLINYIHSPNSTLSFYDNQATEKVLI